MARREVKVAWAAMWDPRVPKRTKALLVGAVVYAISPVDLVPDVIPFLGQLDDLVIVPLAFWMAFKTIPADVRAELEREQGGRRSRRESPT